MATSPNVLNYSILTGIASFTPDGGSKRDLGNAPKFQLTPNITRFEHKSARAGTRVTDFELVTDRALTLNMTLDEITGENLRLALLGDEVQTNSAGNPEFRIYAVSKITGAIEFEGRNDYGSKVNLTLPSCSIVPSGNLDFISTDPATIDLECRVFFVEDLGDFGTCEIIEKEDVSS